MNFDTICKFYINNYSLLKDNKKFRQYLIYSYNLLQTKRSKLKLGSITFELKPLLINGFVLKYDFEMVFSRQPSTHEGKKQFEKLLKFFNWSWDFKNVATIVIFILFIILSLYNFLCNFVKNFISASILDIEHLDIVLQQIFSLVETRPLSNSFIHQSSTVLADLSLYMNLF